MNKIGTAISAIALAGAMGACSYPGSDATKGASIFGGKVDHENIGVATRAQAALVQGDTQAAIQLAEKAVENSPRDAGFRALLGNAYFAAGRFNSADAAYRDSLRLVPVQPKIALKRALVLIAQGRNEAAVMMLNGAQDMLDPADRGLGLALAGRADEAVRILDHAARQPGADGRVRQNLALAQGMKGDWQAARIIASQDVPGHLLDRRLQDWMLMAKAEHPATKLATVLGIHAAPDDVGMPVRLALGADDGNRFAQLAQPEAQAVSLEAPVVPAAAPIAPVAPVAPQPAPIPAYGAAPSAPQVQSASLVEGYAGNIDIQIADVELAEVAADDIVEDELAPQPVSVQPSAMAPIAMASASISETKAAKPAFAPESTRLTQSARSIRSDAKRSAKASRSVVQIAAFSKRGHLNAGWEKVASEHASLNAYAPMAARTVIDGKTFYRLAAHGFASDAEARDFCMELKRAGGECWVRRIEGDAPFRLASRD
ncbi:SPOR domain-containing protein [Sphingomicrobium clamense]|uniref:SPOR domain-containing protein n=1 Tax=Sphingomicrobium clamense TaxID=2851013 RepID=A0ABS6V6V0_9SPHN|nr:SPOR domain-containing protein [Sphingomicrobium sp. B8]MBW0145263.1 SPOR domain-containing protein [Sphingomicrobium sp. B8]